MNIDWLIEKASRKEECMAQKYPNDKEPGKHPQKACVLESDRRRFEF